MTTLKNYGFALIFFYVFFSMTSCSEKNREFNPDTWNDLNDVNIYANRPFMIRDVMDRHLYRGMARSDVVDLLGSPDFLIESSPEMMAYRISIEYGPGIHPKQIQTLIIELAADATVADFWLRTWKRGKSETFLHK